MSEGSQGIRRTPEEGGSRGAQRRFSFDITLIHTILQTEA
jgi:hypothetical protein